MTNGFRAVARRAAGVATGRLGWAPEVFWRATPADLRMALEALQPDPAAPPLARAELDHLLKG